MSSRRLSAFFLILLFFLAQVAIAYIFPGWVPPFVLITVIFYALTEGPTFGALLGCFAGFLLDIIGTGKLGSSMAIYSGIGVFTGFSASKIFYDSFLTQLLLPMMGNFSACFFSLLIYKYLPPYEKLSFHIFRESFILSQPILTVLVSPLMFNFLKKVAGRR